MICAETIKKRHEFSEIFRYARHIQNNLLVVYISENSQEKLRYGICVAKKIGSSVNRNRVRRRLREIVRKSLHRMERKIDILIVARYPCKEASYQQIQEKFLSVCVKAGIIS